MSKDFITIQEAADQLGKSSQTIRRMIKRGDLNAKRIRTPQGFHYVIAKDSIDAPLTQKPMLNDIPVEKPAEALFEAPKPIPTSQKETLINQSAQQVHVEANNPGFDKKELKKIMDRHHKETMLLIEVIQKLQIELDKEQRRPKSFLGYFFDWLSQ